MRFKSTFVGVLWALLSVFFNSNAMDCPEQCKKQKNYTECVLTCLCKSNHRIASYTSTEAGARREWFRRYPCPPGEESDCYYPYRGDYKEGIKRDDEERARWDD